MEDIAADVRAFEAGEMTAEAAPEEIADTLFRGWLPRYIAKQRAARTEGS